MTVPLEIRPDRDVPEAAEICARLLVDGVEYGVNVDSGARTTMLLVDDDDAEFDGETFGAVGSLPIGRRRFTRLIFGPIDLRGGEIHVAPRRPGLRSVVGLDVIGRLCWEFDFSAGTMRKSSDARVLPNVLDTTESGHVWIDVFGSTDRASVLWDTGAAITVVDSTYRRHHADEFIADGNSEGRDVTGSAADMPLYRWRRVTIGGVALEDIRVAELDLSLPARELGRSVDAVCGYTLLRHATWVIDFPHRRWSVART